jgi:Domain of unknown function (DUF4279)
MRTRAAFRLTGDSGAMSAALVTQRLGIKPTTAIEARNRLGRQESIWILSTHPDVHDEPELGSQVVPQLASLLAILEPHSEVLRELTDMGYRATWECRIESQARHAVLDLDRQLMARLLALPGDFRLDVRGDDEDT